MLLNYILAVASVLLNFQPLVLFKGRLFSENSIGPQKISQITILNLNG
jgi:hypothetical protein